MTPFTYCMSALAFLLVLTPYVLIVRRADQDLAKERARVNELLLLLEAQSAPAEVAAFLHPFPQEPQGEFYYSEDGLVALPIEVDD